MSTIRDEIPEKAWQRIVEVFPDQDEGTIATPQNFRDRMDYQIDRYIELDMRRELTPQYRRFGKRHREEIWRRSDRLLREAGEPSHFSQGKER